MKQIFFCFSLLLSGVGSLVALEPFTARAPTNPVYLERADKIVAKLNLRDVDKKNRVRDAIADHYQAVNNIDDAAEVRIKEVKERLAADKSAADAAVKAVRDEAQPHLDKNHAHFLARLSADLSPQEIEEVKDGLTYGVLPLTFRVYQQMLPDLSAEQSAQILAWLQEAREHAMDAGSADKKHAWFGKYKGKINNYLAKAGYNMKQAEKELAERNKAAAKK
jgi:hypothetical protein